MAEPSMEAEVLKYRTFPLKVERYTFPFRFGTTGNVGVCLSGGGSRALAAAMGQLRALRGLNVLGKVKAISSVSGGSWAAVPFTYMKRGFSDEELLGELVPDPGALTLEELKQVSRRCIGYIPTQPTINPAFATILGTTWIMAGLDPQQMWASLVGFNVLSPFGLSTVNPLNGEIVPSYFCWNEQAAQELQAKNRKLKNVEYHTVHDNSGTGNVTRPFHLINTSMFVEGVAGTQGTSFRFLAPVQATPFFSGVMTSLDPGLTYQTELGKPVGFGGVSSFGFNSFLTQQVSTMNSVVQVKRWFSLADATGASSAVFAELIKDGWISTAGPYVKWILRIIENLEFFLELLTGFLVARGVATAVIEKIVDLIGAVLGQPGLSERIVERLERVVDKPDLLDPAFSYWSPLEVLNQVVDDVNPFADGGSLENTGLASLLTYEDIDNAIVFFNTSTPIQPSREFIAVVDEDIPPLFGFQPFQEGKGYQPFPPLNEDPHNSGSQRRFSQVFKSSDMNALLSGLVDAMGSDDTGQCAIFYQQGLEIQPNSWWQIKGGRKINVLWVYMNRSQAWVDQLQPDVAPLVSQDNFPHYPTFEPHLAAQQVNLLAHYTSWVVLKNKKSIERLFQE